MGKKYCEIKNRRYVASDRNGKLFITSEEKKDGFENYVSVLGKVYSDYFMKYLDLDEIDDLYDEELFVKYKGVYFESATDIISKKIVEKDNYVILTDIYQIADQYGFRKLEPFVYTKAISRSELEAIKIVRTHEPPFEEKGTEEIIIEGDDLTEYLESICE
jgi:hypothetical protein